jgi:hypothetical protein
MLIDSNEMQISKANGDLRSQNNVDYISKHPLVFSIYN